MSEIREIEYERNIVKIKGKNQKILQKWRKQIIIHAV